MSLLNILAALYGQPWLLTEAMLETMIGIAHRENDVEAVAAKLGRPLENSRKVTMRDGVAVIPVTGPIFRRADMLQEISGVTSVAALATDLERAIKSDSVNAILLDIDSPGGQVNGISELADMIFDAREKKPVIAYVGGAGASAAYWLASAADEIVINETAMLGSVGAVMAIRDERKKDAMEGIETHQIISTVSPLKQPDAATDKGKKQMLKWLDDVAAVFVESVAKFRGVSADTVRSDFGKGDLLVGQSAVDSGLADRIGSFENVIEELTSKTSTQGRILMDPEEKAAAEAQAKAEAEAGAAAIPATAEAPVTTVDALSAKYPQLVGQIQTEAATAERERILGIDALSRPGKEELIGKCKADPAISVADAALELVNAENDKLSKINTDLGKDAEDAGKVPASGATSDVEDDGSAVSAMVAGGNQHVGQRGYVPGSVGGHS